MIDRHIRLCMNSIYKILWLSQIASQRNSILIASTVVLLAAGCSSNENQNIVENFRVIHPVLIDTTFTKEYVAEIQSVQNVELRSRVSGFIENIHVDEGQFVKAGQTLFSISSKGFREDLLKANAALKSAIAESKVAELEVKRTHKLVENKIISPSELEMAEAKLEAVLAKIDEAKSAVSTAQLQLSFAEVKAPFSGVINRIPNKSGSLIEEGTLLTTLSNNSEVFTYFNMSEQEYMEFIKRQDSDNNKEVSLITADNEVYNLKGKIEIVESEIDKNTGTIAFRARFPNPALLLKHGASGKVLLNTPLKNALLIPQKSTFEIQENLYVYVVNKDNVVQLRSVQPKLRMPHLYVIQSGLTAEDNIIFEGIQRVKEGDKVNPEQVSMDKGFSQLAQK
jgi:RND family efflux transporter MFP subunit